MKYVKIHYFKSLSKLTVSNISKMLFALFILNYFTEGNVNRKPKSGNNRSKLSRK